MPDIRNPSDAEVPLSGGASNEGRVVRVGGTVRRPVTDQTGAIQALLRHLESTGFPGSPRVLGFDDQGREVLTFIEGESVPTPLPVWAVTDVALVSVAQLLKRFHDAVRGFKPDPAYPFSAIARPGFEGTVVCHNDLSPNNVIFQDGRAVGFIDWEAAGPVDPLWDVLTAASHWTPILHPKHLPETLRADDLPRRLALFCDVYGVSHHERPRIIRGIHYFLNRGLRAARWRYEQGLPGFVRLWRDGHGERLQNAKDWFGANRGAFDDALTKGR